MTFARSLNKRVLGVLELMVFNVGALIVVNIYIS